MRTSTACLLMVSAAVVGWLSAVVTAGDQPRKFGLEWTRMGDFYQRKMEINVTHSVGGNVGGYTLPLENDTVSVLEYDNNKGFAAGSQPHGEIEVLKDEKGRAYELSARLGNNRYLDLDADGMIDALYDKRGGKRVSMIVFEGRLVEVEDSVNGFSVSRKDTLWKWGIGRKVRYVFEGGTWKAKDPKERIPQFRGQHLEGQGP